MSKSLKWVLWIAAGLLAVFIFIKIKGGGSSLEKVTVEKAAARTLIESVSTSGKIYPVSEIKIIPEFSGQVTDLKVAEGDTVKKGQLLARVGNRSSLTSPINGIVLSLKVKEGENVTGNSFNTGTEIMTVADMSQLEVRADVGENDIVKLKNGNKADIEVDAYNNRKFSGEVISIANSVKASGPMASQNDITSYEVRIKLDTASYNDLKANNIPFRPGMNARVEIKTNTKDNVLSIPIIAVNARTKEGEKNLAEVKNKDVNEVGGTTDDLEEVVFVLQPNGTVKKVTVVSGIQDMNYIEITKGLSGGEEVVTAPYSAISQRLKTGTKVKVVTKDKLFEKN